MPSAIAILEAAEDLGIELPYECRSGVCGQCKTRLLKDRVVMDSEDALRIKENSIKENSSKEKANGIILACQSHAVSDVVLYG